MKRFGGGGTPNAREHKGGGGRPSPTPRCRGGAAVGRGAPAVGGSFRSAPTPWPRPPRRSGRAHRHMTAPPCAALGRCPGGCPGRCPGGCAIRRYQSGRRDRRRAAVGPAPVPPMARHGAHKTPSGGWGGGGVGLGTAARPCPAAQCNAMAIVIFGHASLRQGPVPWGGRGPRRTPPPPHLSRGRWAVGGPRPERRSAPGTCTSGGPDLPPLFRGARGLRKGPDGATGDRRGRTGVRSNPPPPHTHRRIRCAKGTHSSTSIDTQASGPERQRGGPSAVW